MITARGENGGIHIFCNSRVIYPVLMPDIWNNIATFLFFSLNFVYSVGIDISKAFIWVMDSWCGKHLSKLNTICCNALCNFIKKQLFQC